MSATEAGGLNLDAIRERAGGDLPITSYIWKHDVPDLIAEVERLRGEASEVQA